MDRTLSSYVDCLASVHAGGTRRKENIARNPGYVSRVDEHHVGRLVTMVD